MSLAFNFFPDEVLLNLALSLSLQSIVSLCRTNKRFNRLICNKV